MNIIKHETMFAGHKLTLESGKIGLLSNSAITVSHKDTVILITVNISDKPVDADFFPMMVDYREKYYAAGKVRINRFTKREGRPSDEGVLIARMIDRTIRPLFPKNTRNDVQIVASVLSFDEQTDPAVLSLLGASAALKIAGAPIDFPVAGARVSQINSELSVDVAPEQMRDITDVDLFLAGSSDAIMMVEMEGNEVEDETLIEAFEKGHDEIKKLVSFQEEFIQKVGINDLELTVRDPDPEIYNKVSGFITGDMADAAVMHADKHDLKVAMDDLEKKVLENFITEIENEEFSEDDVKYIVDKVMGKRIRHQVLENEARIDGRSLDDVRDIYVETNLLPRAHGSAIFGRGITHSLSVVTLGGPSDSQMVGVMEDEWEKNYVHHYNFFPYAVGEARPIRMTNRREVGHGFLAEKALKAVLPKKEDFPYFIRVCSEITSCNGSSSMAAVSGSTVSLMAAGVPITGLVTGVAMGLVQDDETGKYKILSDIQAQEDFNGDMDFKLARTEKGITALQMDIKIKGLNMTLVREAMQKAKEATDFMRDEIKKVISQPNKELSPHAPVITTVQVEPKQIGEVIGSGGKVINGLIEEYDVKIDIDDDGLVSILSVGQEKGLAAKDAIRKIVYRPKRNDVFDGEVVRLMDFGAIVKFLPNKDGMVHISQIKPERVNKIEDELKLGDKVRVKVVDVDPGGKTSLSIKDVKPEDKPVM
jgi:polyribonucleotide nucleotidyltransferase